MAATTVITYDDHPNGGKSAIIAISGGAGTSKAVFTPSSRVGFTLTPTGGSSSMQYTRSTFTQVKAGSATWVDFAAASGTQLFNTIDMVTAVRINCASGTALMELRY